MKLFRKGGTIDGRTGLSFIVTGIWHSATGYTSMLFTALGINCGHENVFRGLGNPIFRDDLIGDSSWKATAQLKHFEGTILHQVRDPIKYVNGIIALGNIVGYRLPKLIHYSRGIINVKCIMPLSEEEIKRLPNVPSFNVRAKAAMSEYVLWNELCERGNPHIRYRVEELTPETLSQICKLIGFPRSIDETTEALQIISKKYNTHMQNRPYNVKWGHLPKIPYRDKLLKMAKRYGYLCDSSTSPEEMP